MNEVNIIIISKSEELPEFESHNFFHSRELFQILENTQRHSPYMAIAETTDGRVVAHFLAIIRRRESLFPPYLFTQGRIYGEGDFEDDVNKDHIFGLMLDAITRKFMRKLCFYIEFSDISKKMFAYKHFRDNKYFPVPWQEIHNSLHSLPPQDRASNRTLKKIEVAYKHGAQTHEVTTLEEVHEFYSLMHNFYRCKLRRFLPPEKLITQIFKSQNGKIYITTYKNRIIGGCTCVFSNGNAYLWHLAAKRKSYSHLHPNIITVWKAIEQAYENNYAHIFFLDVGLPYKGNPYREFILSFGGKPVAKYRWFRFFFPWMNTFLSWFYRE